MPSLIGAVASLRLETAGISIALIIHSLDPLGLKDNALQSRSERDLDVTCGKNCSDRDNGALSIYIALEAAKIRVNPTPYC